MIMEKWWFGCCVFGKLAFVNKDMVWVEWNQQFASFEDAADLISLKYEKKMKING